MSQFSVKWAVMGNCSSSMNTISTNLSSYKQCVDNIRKSLPMSENISKNIDDTLKILCRELQTSSVKARSLGDILVNAANKYKSTEKSLGASGYVIGPDLAEWSRVSPASILVYSSSESSPIQILADFFKSNGWSWDETLSLIGSGGIIGSLISAIGGLFTGGVTVESGLNFAKGITDVVGGIADAVPKSGSSFDWKTLFGLNSSESSGNFITELKNSVSKLNVGNAETTAEKVSSYAKWGGYIFTGLLTAYDNFTNEDDKNNSFVRKIAETAGETTIKIGAGIALGALFSTVGAPVLVAGAATVAITWGVDAVCEHFTGKDFAEFLSDTVLDNAENVINNAVDNAVNTVKKAADAGKKALDTVGNAVQSAGNKISGWWSGVTSGISNKISSMAW